MNLEHQNINCVSCLNYENCKKLENKYFDDLMETGGNWRSLLDDGKRVGTPIRRCSHAIVKKHLDKFKNSHVLEIGCGPLSEVDLNFCRENNIVYLGIDPERLPIPTLLPSLKLLNGVIYVLFNYYMKYKSCYKRNNFQSYIKDTISSKYLANESFDLIYANNSIEHWHEEIQDVDQSLELYRKDISRCYSLLKPGGQLLVNAPIHVHGNKIFMHGEVDIIEQFFDWNDWGSVVFEHWREQYDDLMPYAPVHRKKAWLDSFGYELKNIWLGNIVAKKQD